MGTTQSTEVVLTDEQLLTKIEDGYRATYYKKSQLFPVDEVIFEYSSPYLQEYRYRINNRIWKHSLKLYNILDKIHNKPYVYKFSRYGTIVVQFVRFPATCDQRRELTCDRSTMKCRNTEESEQKCQMNRAAEETA